MTPGITSTSDPPALLPLTPGNIYQTDVLEEDVIAPPTSPTETLTQTDTSRQNPPITINDRLGYLFGTAAEMLYTAARDQYTRYETAKGGRHIPIAISKIAPISNIQYLISNPTCNT